MKMQRQPLKQKINFTAKLVILTSVLCSVGIPRIDAAPQLLPPGYLSTRGSQIVDNQGHPVRIASVGGLGTCISTGPLTYDFGAFKGLDNNMAAIAKTGFNCIRVDFDDKNVQDPAMLAQFDELVTACKKVGLKVIFDHHNNEATPANWGNAAQQSNGLWYDVGPGTDGTDGAGDKGTISNATFLADWVSLAKRYAGNSTVVGFDLDNEPHVGYGSPFNGLNWGDGGPGDIWAMFTNVGDAIQAVDPGALIICEGPMDITDKSSIIWWSMDLAHVATKPVILNVPHKVVYSVHEYPAEVSGIRHDHGQEYIDYMNADWGYLVAKNIAPVWVGELGAAQSPTDTDGAAWEATILPYLEGQDGALGGPTFSKSQQPIGTDLWRWGSAPEVGDGFLSPDGSIKPELNSFAQALMFCPIDQTDASSDQQMLPGTWIEQSVNGMNFKVLLPAMYSSHRKYPLVLYLHALDMGDWPEGLQQQIDPWFNTPEWRRSYPAIVVSPLLDQKADTSGETINFGGVSPQVTAGETNAVAAVAMAMHEYRVDRHRVYVTGNSLGGIGTWDILIKYNRYNGTLGRIFCAGMPFAGAVYDHGYPVPQADIVQQLKSIPIWAVHGAQDTQVPTVWDKAIAAALTNCPNFRLTLDTNLAHDVWDTYYPLPKGKETWDWLFAQRSPA